MFVHIFFIVDLFNKICQSLRFPSCFEHYITRIRIAPSSAKRAVASFAVDKFGELTEVISFSNFLYVHSCRALVHCLLAKKFSGESINSPKYYEDKVSWNIAKNIWRVTRRVLCSRSIDFADIAIFSFKTFGLYNSLWYFFLLIAYVVDDDDFTILRPMRAVFGQQVSIYTRFANHDNAIYRVASGFSTFQNWQYRDKHLLNKSRNFDSTVIRQICFAINENILAPS